MWALIIAVFFLATSGGIVGLQFSPELAVLLKYGKNASSSEELGASEKSTPLLLQSTAQWLAGITVPKSWFGHYYVFLASSVIVQLIWVQPWTIRSKYSVIWVLLLIQGLRRLIESYTITKFGASSRMNFSHYLAGISYYIGLSASCFLGQIWSVLKFEPGALDFLALSGFVAASIDQHYNHRHLASLIKYSVPTRGLFAQLASAHYTDELAIYLCVTAIALGHFPLFEEDLAFLSLYVFAVVNLSVTAMATRKYYKQKFDSYKVKWAIVPGIL